MTDNEIIKAFECCELQGGCCGCPLSHIQRCQGVAEEVVNLLNRQKAEIEVLTAENKQLKSDLIIAKQNYEHIKQLWEADKVKVKEVLEKYINKHNELVAQEEQLKAQAVRDFSKFLIDYAEGGSIEVADLPDLIFVYSDGKIR